METSLHSRRSPWYVAHLINSPPVNGYVQFIWGPLSILAAYDTITRAPRAVITQTVVSVGHLFGVLIYAVTFLLDLKAGVSYSRPEAQYFWGYLVGFNLPWAIIPARKWHKSLHKHQYIDYCIQF
jgi:hypothetical protein